MAKWLTAAKVRTAKAGVHGDQFGLRLRVLASGARTWAWRGTVNGRRVDLGLGGWPVVTLSEARDLALECKRAAHRGGRSARGSWPSRSSYLRRGRRKGDRVARSRMEGQREDRGPVARQSS